MKKIHLAALAAVSLAASAPSFAARLPCQASGGLVLDGSFECSDPGNGNYTINRDNPYWTVTDVAGDGVEFRDNIAGTAQLGSTYVELDANHNVTISQAIQTTVGQSYTFSFWYSDRLGQPAATNGLSFSVDGGLHDGQPLSGGIVGGTNNSSDNQWQLYSTTFVATSSSTTLSFTGTGTSDSLGTSLDNVSVNVSPVPEPATMGLMASGLALLGLARRRQSR